MNYLTVAKSLPWAKGVRILECDRNGLLAVEKPEGILSHPNRPADFSKALLRSGYDLEKQAFRIDGEGGAEAIDVFLINRLDSATSGILLLALEADVARSVIEAFEKRKVRKVYAALAFGAVRKGSPVWKDRISVKHSEGGVRAEFGGGGDAETQLLEASPIPGIPLLSRLKLMPITGRTHQLRVQAAKRGVPIVGDRTYGDFAKNKAIAKSRKLKRLCLHCMETELTYLHKGTRVSLKAVSPVPF